MQYLEKMVLLQVIDHHWKDHLLGIDQLRDGIGLRGYGQKDPLIEYKREGFDMFAGLMQRIKADTLERLFKVQIQSVPEQNEPVMGSSEPVDLMSRPPAPQMTLNRGEEPVGQRTVQRDQDKVGRNDPCPCGSGKKYKKCHGR
jgi:preprotein translocase subunit SecA